ncbi:hypothetical protein QAD02_019284 [Eretmocerus hayati]|uniref:Uncharacterized protein n=1 Tax=Eretmocerus hayati TaxID=131215 RepID=A0ACC2PJ53_9HYME|nr:hypothetical protein QAD02_019284 [Eretmocerus hayati]
MKLRLRECQNRNHITDRLRVLRERPRRDRRSESCENEIDYKTPDVHFRKSKDDGVTNSGFENGTSPSNGEYILSYASSEMDLEKLEFDTDERTPPREFCGFTYSVNKKDAVKTPCDSAFKRCHVSDSEKNDYHLKIECVHQGRRCSVEVLSLCGEELPSDADIVIHMSKYKTDHIPHYSRKQVEGDMRKEDRDDLRYMKAAACVDSRNDEVMTFGNVYAAIVSSEDVCRKIYQVVEKKELKWVQLERCSNSFKN